MRLINTYTLDFEDFEGEHIPPYAILSHRWEGEEVLFKDVERGNATTKKGWQKITRCCEQARKDGLSYAWVDTCCIDKSSSAELTEAINSMFRWYQRAQICYVHLCDIKFTISEGQERQSTDLGLDEWSNSQGQGEGKFSEFCHSVWFTRGWALQELLASTSMMFFGRYWQFLGTKDFLCAAISHATRIPRNILTHEKCLRDVPIAVCMSWAARRFTTRVEDRAYSLMGIFGINMPCFTVKAKLLSFVYRKKFSNAQVTNLSCYGILKKLDEPVSSSGLCSFRSGEAFAMTNVGLSITLRLIPWYLDIYLVPLNVGKGPDWACIFLKQHVAYPWLIRVRFGGRAWTYINLNTRSASKDAERQQMRQAMIANEELLHHSFLYLDQRNDYAIHLAVEPHRCWGAGGTVSPGDVIARQKWSPAEPKIALKAGTYEVVAIIRAIRPAGHYSYMYIGFDKEFSPCFVQKKWDNSLTFDAIVEAGPSSGDLSQILDACKFNTSVEYGDTNEQTVIKGCRRPGLSTKMETAIPGLWLSIVRESDGYRFEFVWREQECFFHFCTS